MIYYTEIDGFKKIDSKDSLSEGAYITIYDKLYDDEIALYKIKRIQGDKLNLTLVKILPLDVLTNEEVNPKSIYRYEEQTLKTDGKVNKNQTIYFLDAFYTVKDIMKDSDGSKSLVLDKITVTNTRNLYTIYKTPTLSNEPLVHAVLDDYTDALIALSKLRRKGSEEFYYRFR